ncbi:hypothetical protein V5O48_011266 [Marasmius crinis-equi]|uniref:F-box domain-containing protein n=1 Tax=Marasmius crinis-equi TaxID=585013 RepID=A0ABR3F680_9AGAR
MNRFPDEILSEVFAYTHASHELNTPARHPLHPHAQPRILRDVCRRWRGVAEETRTMWRDFEVTPAGAPPWLSSDDPSPKKEKRARDMVKKWLAFAFLEDSGHGRLSFIFRTASLDGCTTVEREVLRELGKHSRLWQFVHLEMDISLITELVLIHGQLDNLEWLDLVLHGADTVSPSNQFGNLSPREFALHVFSVAPQLRTFSSRGVSPSAPLHSWNVQFPWQELVRVDITDDRSLLESYNVLKLATSAEVISMEGSLTREVLRASVPMITLPSAKCLLYTARAHQASTDDIFRYIDLPNLTELSIDDSSGSLNYYFNLRQLLQRCNPTIRWLELRCSCRGEGKAGGAWFMWLLNGIENSLEYLSLEVVVTGEYVKEKEGRLIVMHDILRSLGVWVWLGAAQLKELVLMVDIGEDVDYKGMAACMLDFERLLRDTYSRRRRAKRQLEVTVVVKGSCELTKRLREKWKGIATALEVDEERVVVLQE